jgi:hypothetical protein
LDHPSIGIKDCQVSCPKPSPAYSAYPILKYLFQIFHKYSD